MLRMNWPVCHSSSKSVMSKLCLKSERHRQPCANGDSKIRKTGVSLDAGEELSLLEDALMEDDSPPGMSPSWTEWQRLEYQVMGARTLPNIHAARYALRHWVERHPEEAKDELVEMLFLLLEVVEERESKSLFVEKPQKRELSGQVR